MHTLVSTFVILVLAALLLVPQILTSRNRRRRWQRRTVARVLATTVKLATLGRSPAIEFSNNVRSNHFSPELRRYALELPEETPLRDLLQGSLAHFHQPDWQRGAREIIDAIDNGEDGATLRDHAGRIADEIYRAVEAADLNRSRLVRWIAG